MGTDDIFSRIEAALNLKRLPPSARGAIWKAVGLVLLAASLLLLSNHWNTGSRLGNGLVGGLRAGVEAILAFAGAAAYIRGRRHAAKAAPDGRPIVLYLRSFNVDASSALPVETGLPFLPSLSPEEEQLALGFQPIGPFTAIGIPGEELAPLGAARGYLSETEWRGRVEELMTSARLVALRIGDTPSLLWELATAVRLVAPKRLVLLVAGKAEYEAFRALAAPVLLKPLPDYPALKGSGLRDTQPPTSVKAIVYFSGDWTPTFVALRAPRWRAGKPLTRALRNAMRPVYEQLELAWSASAPSWPKIIGAAASVLAVAWFVLNELTAPTDWSNPTQAACMGGALELGRARLAMSLPPEAVANCCSNYPWLEGC
jgi:hypothetical protein